MDHFSVFPDAAIDEKTGIAGKFRELGISRFIEACRYVHRLPYGYNSDRDDPMTLFTEQKGSCTTKHAVIATLAGELGLPVRKHIGIYGMTETIVTGSSPILKKYNLPYIPMIHCFLACGPFRVDLTVGNRNGKNTAVDEFLFTREVIPNISAKDEYRLYRNALSDEILSREELLGTEIKTLLHAREEGLAVLKGHVE